MKNWTIAKRMAAALGASVFITLLLGAISWLKTERIFRKIDGIASHSRPDLTLAGDRRYYAAQDF
jgi:CHASE3 domain sensor protein